MYLCEFLPRLGQVSIYVETPHPLKLITGIKFEENTLCISNPDENLILLPRLTGSQQGIVNDQHLTIKSISHDKNQLSLRLEMPAAIRVASSSTFMTMAAENQLWSVRDLLLKTPKSNSNVNQFRFECAECGTEVLDSESSKFGEMPLEFWHELMDFWHCHKPHEEHHNHNDKNYNGKLLLKPGFTYIGASYLLVTGDRSVCSKCSLELGTFDQTNDSTKISKWNLKLTYADKIEEYPPYLLVYHSILDRINSAGVRKISVSSVGDKTCCLDIWITAVGINISINGKQYDNTLKTLYKFTSRAREDDVLEVPSVVWKSFERHLKSMTESMPRELHNLKISEEGIDEMFNVAYLVPS